MIGSALNPINSSMIATALVGIGTDLDVGIGRLSFFLCDPFRPRIPHHQKGEIHDNELARPEREENDPLIEAPGGRSEETKISRSHNSRQPVSARQ